VGSGLEYERGRDSSHRYRRQATTSMAYYDREIPIVCRVSEINIGERYNRSRAGIQNLRIAIDKRKLRRRRAAGHNRKDAWKHVYAGAFRTAVTRVTSDAA